MGLDEGGDIGLEPIDAAMRAALDLLVGEQREPAFDLVEPGGAGRREVEVIARVAGEPGFDGWRFVGGVIVEHQMDVEIGRHGLLDLRQADKHGRVKLQFHWDRRGKRDDKSSCWVRVSQNWAGKGWGGVFIPHVGQEVIVSYQEGDPDMPLVTGRVYNGENTKAINLPANKTQSAIQDHSGNEIVMEGKSGSQDIRVHAVKDMHVVIDHDRDDHVKNNRSYTVDGTSTEKVKKDTSITITEGNYSHSVSTGTATIGVKGKVTETFQDVQETRVTKSITIVSGTSNILIEASTDITLHVGASKLAMYSDGRIELRGKAVAIKGSDAVNVSGMSIKEEADNDHSISGAIVKSSGSVSNTVHGAMVMLNP